MQELNSSNTWHSITAVIGSTIKLCAHTTLGSPFEVIRMRLQNSREMVKQGYLSNNYKGIIDCAKRIAKDEGYFAFLKGNLTHLMRYGLSNVSTFVIADKVKSIFYQDKQRDGYPLWFISNCLSGGISGGIILTLVYPLEFARTKSTNDKRILLTNKKQYKNIIHVFSKTLATNGIKGLYRGYGVSCAGNIIYKGLSIGLFDISNAISDQLDNQDNHDNIEVRFILAWASSFLSQFFTYPIYTISSRMIMTSGQSIKYNHSLDCIRKIIKFEGISSLFKGVSISVFKSVGGASAFLGYSMFLKQQNKSTTRIEHNNSIN